MVRSSASKAALEAQRRCSFLAQRVPVAQRGASESEVYRCQGGNQQLAHKFVAAIGAPKVLTRTIVRSVVVNDKLVRVTLGDGKVLEADHVVLTAPPPTWNRISIDPALPAGLVPQMGTNISS